VGFVAWLFQSGVAPLPRAGQSFPHRSDIVLPARPFLNLAQNVFAQAFAKDLRQFAFVILDRRSAAPELGNQHGEFIAAYHRVEDFLRHVIEFLNHRVPVEVTGGFDGGIVLFAREHISEGQWLVARLRRRQPFIQRVDVTPST
jgi:hypothetical protein